ncbi:MAG: N-methyl-L-tryptophan oxidase [Verrucomicrobia bacterium]|nr:MAG: N-methyl-L-tryptophan oxidase [Verrucomicrobiota bacterium]
MAPDYDVIIAGLGAMGSAAAYHLAKTGRHVLGLDRFEPPHQFGSSHGLTRIIREAYFEHPLYVPLVQRAYELWADLEKQSGQKLLLQTSGLMLGRPDGVLVRGARRSAEEHHLKHRVLSCDDMRREFPMFQLPPDMVAVWEPRAGILFPEAAIRTHIASARAHGAELVINSPVEKWEPETGGVRVHAASGVYTARQILLSPGAWMTSLAPDLKLPLAVERQVLCWFQPRSEPGLFSPQRCPIFICEHQPGRFFYGFPDLGDGVKIGVHHEGAMASPDRLDRQVKDRETEIALSLLRQFLPRAAGPVRSAMVCMYTNTPDEHFLLDWHPHSPQVLIASPCSGHGFKFSPVIGELAASLLSGARSPFDLSLFRLDKHLGT